MVGTLGLALFLYAVGVQYGKQFFLGLTSAAGRRANLMAIIGVLLAGAVSLFFVKAMGLNLGHALGLFAGSGTSTPTLQAAIATLGNDDPAVGYSVSYPFGVAGPILFLYIAFMILKPKIDVPAGGGLELLEIALRNPDLYGKTLGEVMSGLPPGVQIVALRRAHHNEPAVPSKLVAEGDVVLATALSKDALGAAAKRLGEPAPGRIAKDRSDLDYVRVFASRPAVVGRALGDLELPGTKASIIAHVRRGDADIAPRPDLVLEFGDRIGLLAHRSDFAAMRKFFGDSIKGTAEFSYISIGLGMALGFLVGAIQVPLPGIGKLAIGLAGVLVVALILGNLRRTGGMNWTIPLSANLVLRNLGLTLFLAQVGMASGPKFAATVTETGLLMLGLGAIVLVALVLPILILGLFVYRMPYDEVAGIVAGACGNPAILAYSNKLAPTDRPDIGYAMIFPGMTIVKILFVDIVPAFF
jgi:putative transport protein